MQTRDRAMAVPGREPFDLALHVAISAAATLTILFLLRPPPAVFWGAVVSRLGETATFGLVVAVAVGAGAWFARTSGFGLVPLALGTVVGYGVGMLAIEIWLKPASLAYLPWYALLAGGVLGGALLWWVVVRLYR